MHELLERRCLSIESPSEDKQRIRDELAALTEQFLAAGKQIYVAPPSQFIVHKGGPRTAINIDREVARSERIAKLPGYLFAPRNESGCKGVVRDGVEWVARWGNRRVGKYPNMDLAISALIAHLDKIGYNPESDMQK